MKLRLMLLCCLLLVLPVVSGNSYAQSQDDGITESKVMELLNSVDKAARKGNVAGMVAPLASDVKIKLIFSTPGSDKEQVADFTKEQYVFHTRRERRGRLKYTLERKNIRVKIYNDNKTAMVVSDLYETVTIAQGTLRTVSSETLILNLRDGKIVVTSDETRVRFY